MEHGITLIPSRFSAAEEDRAISSQCQQEICNTGGNASTLDCSDIHPTTALPAKGLFSPPLAGFHCDYYIGRWFTLTDSGFQWLHTLGLKKKLSFSAEKLGPHYPYMHSYKRKFHF